MIAREAQRIEKIIQWLQMVLMIAGQVGQPGFAQRIAKLEVALTQIGRDLGVPGAYIVDEAERKKMDDDNTAAAVAAAAAAVATEAGGGVP